jgi:hypothetical protein
VRWAWGVNPPRRLLRIEYTGLYMNAQEKPVILILADISGYTKFIVSNAKKLAHTQLVIKELIETIVKQIEIPLEITKLEGDAVFLFSVRNDDEEWQEKKKAIGRKLLTFVQVFRKKIVELQHSTACVDSCCANIEKLKLKIIVHSGTAVFHEIGRFQELLGVDVIIVHRLLKNSLQAKEYILMTDAAYRELEFEKEAQVARSSETIEEIGKVQTCVYFPPTDEVEQTAAFFREPLSQRLLGAAGWNSKQLVQSIVLMLGLKKPDLFNNIRIGETEPTDRYLGLLHLLNLPILLVLQPITILQRWRKRKTSEV